MKQTKGRSAATPLILGAAGVLIAMVFAVSAPDQANSFPAAETTPVSTSTAAPALASDAESALITINPQRGFPLDPFLVSVQGGGPVEAKTLDAACTGYVPVDPAVIVEFQGSHDLLRALFLSDGDTTLMIRTPDGDYVCGDDLNRLILDPAVAIDQPAPGRYAVWVGSKVATDLIPGFLVFTTHTQMDASRLILGNLVKRRAAPDFIPMRARQVNAAARLAEAEAAATPVALVAGEVTVTNAFTATGELPAVELQTGDTLCGGLVTIAPDFAFDWSGATEALTLLVEADADTTLLVSTPDGNFLCADDADGNLNPVLVIPEPVAGRHLVWIGRVDPSEPVSGMLTLTEAAGALPIMLEPQQ